MALTDAEIRQAKPETRAKKLFDGRGSGLFLLVSPAGSKHWRLKYRFAGQEKLISLGAYPAVSLADARARANDARKAIAAGVDPATQRRMQRQAAADTFEVMAREWFETNKEKWAPSYSRVIPRRLEQNVYPWLGKKAIREITAPEILAVLRRIEKRGANETAHRVRELCSQVFRYAIASGRAESDPTRDLRGALAPAPTRHFPAMTDPAQVAGLLRAIDGYNGSAIVRSALRLAPLVFVRPGELRQAEWAEIDLAAARWVIPSWRTKMKQSLIVPLARQAVEILGELRPLTGDGRYVFPSEYNSARPMSENAVLGALRRLGVSREEMVGHGFRAMARTMLDELLHVRVDYIEAQLGHVVRDPLGRAYNRTAHIKERTEMMQTWADYLETLKAGSAEQQRA